MREEVATGLLPIIPEMKNLLLPASLLVLILPTFAEPLLNSWFTEFSGL